MAIVRIYDTLDVDQLDSLPDLPGLPAEYRNDKADALLIPEGHGGIIQAAWRTAYIITRWGKVVRTAPNGGLYTTPPQNGKIFVTPSTSDMLKNGPMHPKRPGLPRYAWFADPDDPGVEYG